MKLNFPSNFSISIGARHLDRQLCDSINSDLTKLGLEEREQYQAYSERILALPSIAIFASDEFSTIRDTSKVDFILTIPSPNINLFECIEEDISNTISLSDENEWQRVKKEIFEVLKLWISNRDTQIQQIAFENLKKISKNKERIFEISSKKINELEESLANFSQTKQFYDSISTIIENIFEEKIEVIESSHIKFTQLKHVYPFGFEASECYIYCAEEQSVIAQIIFQYTRLISIRFDHSRNGQLELLDGNFLLQRIPFPIALIDKNDELLLHNDKFLNLNISVRECLSFEDNAQIEINKLPYKVKSKYIGNDTRSKLYYFYPLEDLFSNEYVPTNEEMGIVSSSIAHELNNPLAGILAAIDVIFLDEIPSEVESSLLDMKEGVKRCKELVETFLGFSRATPHQSFDQVNIFSSFKQAIELLRFRLIENKINLILNHDLDGEFEPNINPHVLVMIYYMLLGDLLTSYTHRNLVTNNKSSSILIEFIEKTHGFSIKIPRNFGLDRDFVSSKLLKHLMETQRLCFDFSLDQINFTYK